MGYKTQSSFKLPTKTHKGKLCFFNYVSSNAYID